jgi:hypothetical protein
MLVIRGHGALVAAELTGGWPRAPRIGSLRAPGRDLASAYRRNRLP